MAPQEDAHAEVGATHDDRACRWGGGRRGRDRRGCWGGCRRGDDGRLGGERVAEGGCLRRVAGGGGFEERTARGLRRQVVGQTHTGQQVLQIVRQQQALRAAAPAVVVHHPALEALIDEFVVVRIVRRLAGRQTPQLQVQEREQAGVGVALRKRV